MASAVQKILEEIYKLPKAERDLVRAELDDLDDTNTHSGVDAEWDEEIARRVSSVQDGSAVLHSDDYVQQRIRKALER